MAENDVGELEFIRYYIDGSLSVDKQVSDELILSPNTSNGAFAVSHYSGAYPSVSIFTLSGQKVKEQKLEKKENNYCSEKKEGICLYLPKTIDQ